MADLLDTATAPPDLWSLLRQDPFAPNNPTAQSNQYPGVSNQAVYNAQRNSIGNVGALLLSAAQRQSPDQKAQTIAKIGEAANIMPGLNEQQRILMQNQAMQTQRQEMQLRAGAIQQMQRTLGIQKASDLSLPQLVGSPIWKMGLGLEPTEVQTALTALGPDKFRDLYTKVIEDPTALQRHMIGLRLQEGMLKDIQGQGHGFSTGAAPISPSPTGTGAATAVPSSTIQGPTVSPQPASLSTQAPAQPSTLTQPQQQIIQPTPTARTYEIGPSGVTMKTLPPVSYEAAKEGAVAGAKITAGDEATKQYRIEQSKGFAEASTAAAERALAAIKNQSTTDPVTGMTGALLAGRPGFTAYQAAQDLKTVENAHAFQQMNLRSLASTGGGTGTGGGRMTASIFDKYIEAGPSLAQGQGADALIQNLKTHLEKDYTLLYGPEVAAQKMKQINTQYPSTIKAPAKSGGANAGQAPDYSHLWGG